MFYYPQFQYSAVMDACTDNNAGATMVEESLFKVWGQEDTDQKTDLLLGNECNVQFAEAETTVAI